MIEIHATFTLQVHAIRRERSIGFDRRVGRLRREVRPGETSGEVMRRKASAEVMLLRRREEKEPVAFGGQSGFAWSVSPSARPVPLCGLGAAERWRRQRCPSTVRRPPRRAFQKTYRIYWLLLLQLATVSKIEILTRSMSE